MVSNKTSTQSLCTVAMLMMLALLVGCGGGGAKDPFAPGPSLPALVVNPTVLNVYPGVPVVLTINSGVGPFQVFSSDSTVLPVTQVVPGAAITMTANAVAGDDRAVTITVRDAAGQAVLIAATVKPSPLLSKLEITSISNTQCPGRIGNTGSGSPAADIGPRVSICTGETGVAEILVKNANTSPVQNRQIRFDVLQGPYNFALGPNGSTLAKTATILTDQNGSAIVTVKTDASVGTQIALIRATDTLSGNRVDTWFTVVQSTAGVASFQLSPSTATVPGYFADTCGVGTVAYVIYGGTPPYNVSINATNVALLEIGTSRGQQIVVPTTNTAFNVLSMGGACVANREFVITVIDATGRVINGAFISSKGTFEPPPPPPPDTLIVTPPNQNLVCSAGRVVNFTIGGGTGPYTVATDYPYIAPPSPPPPPPPSNGVSVLSSSAIRLNQVFATGTVITISVADSKSVTTSTKVTCL